MIYKAYLKQSGEGCDYTIGCGRTMITIIATDIEDAKIKLIEEIEDNYSGDQKLVLCELYEINEVFTCDLDEIYNVVKKEKIYLTEDELMNFDFTGGSKWELRNEIYNFIVKIRTDEMSDGESWDIVVKRESDDKFFKWNCWDAGSHNGYMMENGDNYMEEVFPKVITKTVYE